MSGFSDDEAKSGFVLEDDHSTRLRVAQDTPEFLATVDVDWGNAIRPFFRLSVENARKLRDHLNTLLGDAS